MSSSLQDPVPRPAVISLPPYVPGRRATSATTAPLASNESPFSPLPSVRAVVAFEAARVNRYPDGSAARLRSRIASELAVDVDEVAVGPGSVGMLQQIITAVCDAGAEVVFAWRSFEAYPLLVTLAGAVPVPVPLRADEHHDLDAIAEAITGRTRVVLLCTPNNPTGVSIRHDELVAFLDRVPRDVLIVIDEAYVEFDDDVASVDAMTLYRRYTNVCVLRTFSKAYGLAGLRVGYGVARLGLAEALRRTALPFAVTDLAQSAAVASLNASKELTHRVREIVDERNRVLYELRLAGLDLPESHGNFVWLRTDDRDRERVLDALFDADILARGYPGDGVRITIADRVSNDRVLAVLTQLEPALGQS